MERIVIIGMGLIGGSLGLALRAAKLKNIEVVGVDFDRGVLNQAKRLGAVDSTEGNPAKAVSSASLVIVATPILAFPEVFQTIAPHLPDNCVVTDVGSTKAQVLRWASEHLPPKIGFVGGHPMAGKEVAGIEGASATLFQGTRYCIVPAPTASKEAVELLVGVASQVGAQPFFADPEEHDVLVGGISHLPLVLSAALMATAAGSPAWREMALLASSGFRDTTRLAASDPGLTRGIGITNQASVLRWIDGLQETLATFRNLLQDDPEAFLAAMDKARDQRLLWMADRQGLNKAESDLPNASEMMTDLFVGRGVASFLKQQDQRLADVERKTGARGDADTKSR
ncbi:MAG: prephenate dehydrogenase [Dehalococcoidia bacterium]|nr:prephenate dehydrogenase [Dehalococcoidia bacterium]